MYMVHITVMDLFYILCEGLLGDKTFRDVPASFTDSFFILSQVLVNKILHEYKWS